MKRPQVIGKYKDELYFLCSRCLQKKKNDNVNMVAISSTCCYHLIVDSFLAFNRNNTQSLSIPRICIVNKPELFITDANKSHVALSSVPFICTFTCNDVNTLFKNVFCMDARDNLDLLSHNRLDHVPFSKMRNIPTLSAQLFTKQPFLCTICPMARQQRLLFN